MSLIILGLQVIGAFLVLILICCLIGAIWDAILPKTSDE